MSNNNYEINLTYGSMTNKIIRFAIPLILSGVLQLLFNAADSVVVGKFAGKDALASVGSNGALVNLLVNLFIGLSLGATITVSRYFGKNNNQGMERASHTTIAISLICGIFLAIVGNILAIPLLKIMGVPENILPLSALYLRIYFAGMPFSMLYNFTAGIMRSYGDTKSPLNYLTLAGIINVILNLVFVIVFKMSVVGVALATVISQAVSAFLALGALTKETNACKIYLNKIKVHKKELLMIIQAGIPSGIQSIMFAISNVIVQSALNSFGSSVMAAAAAASQIASFVYIPLNALGNTSVTVASQNFGAGNFARIKKGWNICSILAVAVSLITCAITLIFSPQLIGLFSDNLEVIRLGVQKNWYLIPPYIICGIMEISVGMLRGIGYYMTPMLVSVLGICGLRILWIHTVFAKIHTLPCLYLTYAISWTFTALIQTILFFVLRRKKEKEHHIA